MSHPSCRLPSWDAWSCLIRLVFVVVFVLMAFVFVDRVRGVAGAPAVTAAVSPPRALGATDAADDPAHVDGMVGAPRPHTPGVYIVHMLDEQGTLAAARSIITASQPSVGFSRLWELGHPALTVEAVHYSHDSRRCSAIAS